MCGLRSIQLSFNFRESSAFSTALSFFTVITTGDTKQFSSTLYTFSKCPTFIIFSSSRPTSSCRCSGIGLAFVSPGSVRVTIVYLFRYLYCPVVLELVRELVDYFLFLRLVDFGQLYSSDCQFEFFHPVHA